MKLTWSRFALADRDNIFNHIEPLNPIAAALVDERIALGVRRLTLFPESGRPGRIEGTRELVIPNTPYIAAYIVSGDTVRLPRVLHGAQMWPDEIRRE